MGYQVKWVEKNLGITRKALRTYEDKGLIPKNEHGKYRNYSDNEIKALWLIKVINGIGYSLNEIRDIINNQDYDFLERLPEKIEKLYREKEEIEKRIGYAEMIKLTGGFPSMPKEMGTVKFDDFYHNSLEKWNVNADDKTKAAKNFIDFCQNLSSKEPTEEDVDELLNYISILAENSEMLDLFLYANDVFLGIIKQKEKGKDSHEIQSLIHHLYEKTKEMSQSKDLSVKSFVRLLASSFINGDIGKLNQNNLGKENCAFIADALAVFGGYASYSEIEY